MPKQSDDELRAILVELSDAVDNAGISIFNGTSGREEWSKAFLKAEDELHRYAQKMVVEELKKLASAADYQNTDPDCDYVPLGEVNDRIATIEKASSIAFGQEEIEE